MNGVISFLGDNFALVCGIVYIGFKILLRILIHRLAQVESSIDNWPMYSWSMVDLALLAISISVSVNLPGKMNYSYNKTAVFYFVLVACLIISSLLYGLFIKNRQRDGKRLSPFSSWSLFGLYTLTCFFGATPYVFIFENLVV